MSTLVNISQDPAQSVFIDASDVTGVGFFDGNNKVFVFNSKGVVFEGDATAYKDIAETLRAAGTPLEPFVRRFGVGNETFLDNGETYINPAAVNYVGYAQKRDKDLVALSVGVEGIGRVQSSETTPAELAALLAAVREAKPMVECKDARGATLIDAAKVTSIVDQGIRQPMVFFGKDSTTIFVERTDVNEIFNKMTARAKLGDDVDAIYAKAEAAQKVKERGASYKIVNDIAKASGNLITIAHSQGFYCLRGEDIGTVTATATDKKEIVVQPQRTAANPNAQGYHLTFNHERDLAEALATLQGNTLEERRRRNAPKP